MFSSITLDAQRGGCEVNYYFKTRAALAAMNLAGLMANPEMVSSTCESLADTAILAADTLLDRLGLVNPDTTCEAA